MNSRFKEIEDVPTDYRNFVLNIKEKLDAGSVVYTKGYPLVINNSWNKLSEEFLDVMHSILLEHTTGLFRASAEKNYDIDDSEALEGYKSDKSYLQTKRNRDIVCKRKKYDDFTCQVCGFRLKINGRFIVECHHLISFKEESIRITKIEDLVCLCPTCHRIAHTHKPPYSVVQLKNLVKQIRR